MAVIAADGLGTAKLEWTPHEFLAVQLTDGSAGLLDGTHGDKGKPFRTLGAVVHHDLGITDTADTIEKLEEVTLGGIVGQIANVQALCRDIARVWGGRSLTTGFWLTRFTVLA